MKMLIEKGRVCLKIAGREAGKYCIVLEQPRDGFVTIAGPKAVTGVKRRKCSIFHIEPTEHMLETGGATDSELESGWKSSGLVEKLGIVIPQKRKPGKAVKERSRDARVQPAEKRTAENKASRKAAPAKPSQPAKKQPEKGSK
jgi:large subunit ribosomal protein L14e